jgi:hypothetical protein
MHNFRPLAEGRRGHRQDSGWHADLITRGLSDLGLSDLGLSDLGGYHAQQDASQRFFTPSPASPLSHPSLRSAEKKGLI